MSGTVACTRFPSRHPSYTVWLDGKEIGRVTHVWITGGLHVWRGGHVSGLGFVSSYNRTRKEIVAQIVAIETDLLHSMQEHLTTEEVTQ